MHGILALMAMNAEQRHMGHGCRPLNQADILVPLARL